MILTIAIGRFDMILGPKFFFPILVFLARRVGSLQLSRYLVCLFVIAAVLAATFSTSSFIGLIGFPALYFYLGVVWSFVVVIPQAKMTRRLEEAGGGPLIIPLEVMTYARGLCRYRWLATPLFLSLTVIYFVSGGGVITAMFWMISNGALTLLLFNGTCFSPRQPSRLLKKIRQILSHVDFPTVVPAPVRW